MPLVETLKYIWRATTPSSSSSAAAAASSCGCMSKKTRKLHKHKHGRKAKHRKSFRGGYISSPQSLKKLSLSSRKTRNNKKKSSS